jgi:hypothetical protein
MQAFPSIETITWSPARTGAGQGRSCEHEISWLESLAETAEVAAKPLKGPQTRRRVRRILLVSAFWRARKALTRMV